MTEHERREKIEALLQVARTLYDQNHEGSITATTESGIALTFEGTTKTWTRAKVAVVLMDVYKGLKDSRSTPLGNDDLLPDWLSSTETLFTELQNAMTALTEQERNEQPSQP